MTQQANGTSFQDAHYLASLLDGRQTWDQVPPAQRNTWIAFAEAQRVFPLLYQAIESYVEAGDPLYTDLRRKMLNHKASSVAVTETVKCVNAALMNAGIPALWLKGIALAHTVYAHPWLRSMVDVDVLVPYDQDRTAVEVLEQAGLTYWRYRLGGVQFEPFAEKDFKHHYVLFSHTNVPVELHFDISIRPYSKATVGEMFAWFWDHSHIVETEVGSLRVLVPESELLLGTVHDFLQHQAEDLPGFLPNGFKLYRKYDQYLLLQGDLNADDFVSQTAHFDWSYPVWQALEQTHSLFDLESHSGEIGQKLSAHDGTQDAGAYVLKKNASNRELKRHRDALGSLSLIGKFQYIWRRLLFPKESWLRESFNDYETPLWRLRLIRLVRLARRMLRLLVVWLSVRAGEFWRSRRDKH